MLDAIFKRNSLVFVEISHYSINCTNYHYICGGNMYKINIEHLRPGMVIGKTISSSDGIVLLSEGLTIKEHYIDKLIESGISEICVRIDELSEVKIIDIIQEENRQTAKILTKQTMEKINMGDEFSTAKITEIVSTIIEDLLNDEGIILNLSDIRAVDDYTFDHCVNVCVLSIVTGIALGYDKEKLLKLGVGAILHDIGKILVSQEILNKPGALEKKEYDEIKKHAELGYHTIIRHTELDTSSMMVILEHHERYNGTGYPAGKKRNEIHEFSRIVAIADVYDALTSDRVYKKRICPSEAIEHLVSMSNHDFDHEILEKFLKHVTSYPIGTMVLLNSGIRGVVSGKNNDYPSRPKVKCIMDQSGNKIKYNAELELIYHPSVTITKVLEDIS